MATPVIMPRQGQSVESCIISKWYKKKNDKVEIGDVLFAYETDKASFEEISKVAGVLLDVFFNEDDDVQVLTNVCVIGNPGEKYEEFIPVQKVQTDDKIVIENIKNELNEQEEKKDFIPIKIKDEEIKISPRAKNLADKLDINYNFAVPSGPNNRIIERDILTLKEKGIYSTDSAKDEYLNKTNIIDGTGIGGRVTLNDLQNIKNESSTGNPKNEFIEVKHSNIRKVIARSMQKSLLSTAQLTLNTSFDVTEILNLKRKLKESTAILNLEKITINDILLFAVSRTILNHKELNAHYYDDKMLLFSNVHLGIAVDTERGLMVPTLFYANQKSLNQIAKETKKIISDCQKGSINPDILKDATFTITNLGTLGIESFTPVLNPPQTGILGVNNIIQRIKIIDDKPVYYPAIGLSLTFDHRAFDGATAAKYLQNLVKNLENISILLVN